LKNEIQRVKSTLPRSKMGKMRHYDIHRGIWNDPVKKRGIIKCLDKYGNTICGLLSLLKKQNGKESTPLALEGEFQNTSGKKW